MTTEKSALFAICTSAANKEIVHLRPETMEELEVMDSELSAESDEEVSCGTHREFWGTDEDGDEWRVHLHMPASEP